MTGSETEWKPDDNNAEHIAVYQRFRSIFGEAGGRSADARKRVKNKKDGGKSVPFGEGRDPSGIDDVLDALTNRMGWSSPLARADLLASWSEVAGAETAEHSTPVGIEDGVLTVHCDSTAWANRAAVSRSWHCIGEVRWPQRPLVETRPQINPRTGPSRYLRLGDKKTPSGLRSPQ
jgi:hypothetical protein